MKSSLDYYFLFFPTPKTPWKTFQNDHDISLRNLSKKVQSMNLVLILS